jgi:hypothetical protein
VFERLTFQSKQSAAKDSNFHFSNPRASGPSRARPSAAMVSVKGAYLPTT